MQKGGKNGNGSGPIVPRMTVDMMTDTSESWQVAMAIGGTRGGETAGYPAVLSWKRADHGGVRARNSAAE